MTKITNKLKRLQAYNMLRLGFVQSCKILQRIYIHGNDTGAIVTCTMGVN